MSEDELTGFMIPGAPEGAYGDIGPKHMSNPAFVAFELWRELLNGSTSAYRFRQLLTPDSPMWADDLAEAREVLASRNMLTRVSDPADPEGEGIPWQDVAKSDLTEVHARFTASDIAEGYPAAQTIGTVSLRATDLVLQKQGRQWRAHALFMGK